MGGNKASGETRETTILHARIDVSTYRCSNWSRFAQDLPLDMPRLEKILQEAKLFQLFTVTHELHDVLSRADNSKP